MASSQTGVYGGLPFSYLSTNSPTDKQPPRSPRSSRPSDSDRPFQDEAMNRNSDPELQPFSYLSAHNPTDREKETVLADQRESYDNSIPIEGEPGYYSNGGRIGSNPSYFTSVKDFTRDNERGECFDRNMISENEQKSAYVVSDYTNVPHNYDYSTGSHIPRPKIIGDQPPSDFDDPRSPRAGRQFHYFPDDQYKSNDPTSINGKTRPLTRDSYLDGSHRQPRSKCSCAVVSIVVVMVIVAIGVGFAAGWFASEYLGRTNGTIDTTTTTMTTTPSSLQTSPVTVNTTPTTTTTSTTTKPLTAASVASTVKPTDPPTTVHQNVTT